MEVIDNVRSFPKRAGRREFFAMGGVENMFTAAFRVLSKVKSMKLDQIPYTEVQKNLELVVLCLKCSLSDLGCPRGRIH